jgi:hypothetical protein
MIPDISVQHVVDELARDPLRNIVLLKHLQAFPTHSKVQQGFHRACSICRPDAVPDHRPLFPRMLTGPGSSNFIIRTWFCHGGIWIARTFVLPDSPVPGAPIEFPCRRLKDRI